MMGDHATWVPDIAKCMQTAREVASAMAYLHGQNMLHSDLNGNNILLSMSDQNELVAKVHLCPGWKAYVKVFPVSTSRKMPMEASASKSSLGGLEGKGEALRASKELS